MTLRGTQHDAKAKIELTQNDCENNGFIFDKSCNDTTMVSSLTQ